MAEVAHPGMGQDEKDRIGQAEMDARRIDAGEFDAVSKDALAAEVARRGINVKDSATKADLINALKKG
jgi:hypothetical protein